MKENYIEPNKTQNKNLNSKYVTSQMLINGQGVRKSIAVRVFQRNENAFYFQSLHKS